MSARRYIAAASAIGQTFNRLTVLRIERRNSHPFGVCRCSCGVEVTAHLCKVRSGHTKSCGCLLRQSLTTRNRTHGCAGSATYRIWHAMKNRCNNPRSKCFSDYGGRGITVCERWQNSFEAFIEDMGDRPAGLEIDRIDNEGNYEPGNCRWATRKTQNRNSRHNHTLTHNGRTQPLSAWAEELGVTRKVIYGRIRRGEPIVG